MIFSVHRALKAGVKVSFHLVWRTRIALNGQWLHIRLQHYRPELFLAKRPMQVSFQIRGE